MGVKSHRSTVDIASVYCNALMAKKHSTSTARSVGAVLAAAVRDVLIASINKGQFPFAMLGLVLLTLIVKMPSADVSKLVFRLVDGVERGSLLGYLLSLLFLAGWYVHARYQRRVITREIGRIAAERNMLQSRNLGQQRIKSSGRPQ
jgi:hypothetical protein